MSEWPAITSSMILHQQHDILQNCSPDVVEFKQKWVLKAQSKRACFIKQKGVKAQTELV